MFKSTNYSLTKLKMRLRIILHLHKKLPRFQKNTEKKNYRFILLEYTLNHIYIFEFFWLFS